MSRTTVAGLGVLAVAFSVGMFSFLADGDTQAEQAETVQAPSGTAATAPIVAPEGIAAPARPLIADPVVADPPKPAAQDPPPDGSPLLVTVLHARGRPASGGRVALYDADRHMLAEGVLDTGGRWGWAGFDGPVEIFVLGLTVEPARFELASGRGEHEFDLPDGAWLEGQLLINGAPPGRPFPLKLTTSAYEYGLFEDHDTRPTTARIAGEITSSMRGGGFLTDSDGRFMVSGLPSGSEVDINWPRFYHLDEQGTSPFPVTVPAAGRVLALRRPHMIRGRVLTARGQPAPDARLSVELRFTFGRDNQPATSGSRLRARQTTLTFSDSAVDRDGRFAIAIGDPSSLSTKDPEDIDMLMVIDLAVQLLASTADGSWVRVELPKLDVLRDHDLGDLVLQPVQRVVLEVVDPEGKPVVAARVRPESQRVQTRSLLRETDAAGRVEIDMAVATEGFATIVAPDFRMEVVELPQPPPEEPLRVVLSPGCGVHLSLRGPWNDERDEDGDDEDRGSRDAWRFYLSVSAQDGVFEDSAQPPLPGGAERFGPDDLRELPEGHANSGGSTIYADGRVEFSWNSSLPEWHFEGLRPRHALLFQVEVTDCPESFGPAPTGVVWESAGVFLGDGEQRELVADLWALQPGR